LESEKVNTKKVEKELKKTRLLLTEQQDMSARHKQVAVMLIKERKELVRRLVEAEQAKSLVETSAGEVAGQRTTNQKTEAMLERQLIEFDMEREQYKARLAREESRNSQLTADIERLSMHIEQLQLQMGVKRRVDNGSLSGEIKPQIDSVVSPTSRVFPNGPLVAKVPAGLATFRNTPPHTPPESRRTSSALPDGVLPSRIPGNHDYVHRQASPDNRSPVVARPMLASAGVSPLLNSTLVHLLPCQQ
jgi:type IV secretory pathway VirJ component